MRKPAGIDVNLKLAGYRVWQWLKTGKLWKRTFSSKCLLTWLTASVLCLGLLIAYKCSGNSHGPSPLPVPATTVTGTLELVAGNCDGPGSRDGIGPTAQFSDGNNFHGHSYLGMTTDSAGNIYVGDVGNHTIRKITPAGVVTTIAGTPDIKGSADGVGQAAQFNYPTGVARDKKGNLYVADTINSTIRKITSAGVVTTLAGTAGQNGSVDGVGPTARFHYPRGIVIDSASSLYVADTLNGTIRKITPEGNVTTYAGDAHKYGSADGAVRTALFRGMTGLAIDAADNLYVADSMNNTIRKITPAGIVSTLAGLAGKSGDNDGSGQAASFSTPTSITVDVAGNLYVADHGNSQIRKITPKGMVTTRAGTKDPRGGSNDGPVSTAKFRFLTGITIDASGNLYVFDGNAVIRKISPAGMVSTLAGKVRRGGSNDGTGDAAQFDTPEGIVADAAGNMYVADTGNHTIRKITPAGIVTTLAGTAGKKGSSDDKGAFASFYYPNGITMDSNGNLYVFDAYGTIRKVTPDGVTSTLAGSVMVGGNYDSPTNLAQFGESGSIMIDTTGTLYVSDTSNNTIRKITPDGVVSTLFGNPGKRAAGYSNGVGWTVLFDTPRGITIDAEGNLYVADSSNNVIRKITRRGFVSTLAGKYVAGEYINRDGTGSEARFWHPAGITIDKRGNLYVADMFNHTIRKITHDGVVTTIAGLPGQEGIRPGKLPGGLDRPSALTYIEPDTLAITSGNSILKLTLR